MSVSKSNEFAAIQGTVGGYAPLDSGLLVPRAYLPQIAGLLHNMGASTNPAVTDDSGDGYGIGSRWLNTTLDLEFVCLDASVGAAVWRQTTASNLVSGRVQQSTNRTTSSTSFADITEFSITKTTGARPVLIGAVLSVAIDNAAGEVAFDVDIDGTRLANQAFGIVYAQQHATISEFCDMSFTALSAPLTAASHTFKLQWRVGNAAHTATLIGDSGGVGAQFWVVELYAA